MYIDIEEIIDIRIGIFMAGFLTCFLMDAWDKNCNKH